MITQRARKSTAISSRAVHIRLPFRQSPEARTTAVNKKISPASSAHVSTPLSYHGGGQLGPLDDKKKAFQDLIDTNYMAQAAGEHMY